MKARVEVNPYQEEGYCIVHGMLVGQISINGEMVYSCYGDPMKPHYWKVIEV